jgi:parallel beta-helix repeat protein
MKKIVPLAFVLVLLSTAVVIGSVRPAVAQGRIYIRANGLVEGTDKIVSVDNVTYTFTGNINDSIVVERDNIVVDGEGYTIQGTGSGIGIDLSDRSNVTIKNMEIKKFGSGIGASNSSNNSISGNNITNNGWNGVEFTWHSSHNSIIGNNIKVNNHSGVVLTTYSSYNNISRNNITNNDGYGIFLFDSYYNRIYHNNFINNTEQVYIWTRYESLNEWDDDAGRGNYWSDYEEKYPDAEEIDGTGIWDTPYVIDEDEQDNYPIVPEFPTWTSMLLLLMVLTVAIAIYKRRLLKTQIH